MSADDTPESDETEPSSDSDLTETGDESADRPGKEVRQRLEKEADRAIDQFDERLVDLLAWMLETETRARIYVHLRQHPESTSDEIAEGTGLYPSTVREALASLHDEGKVRRNKRQNAGAGNNPYEYSAMPPSELVSTIADDVQRQLNTVFNLDRYIDRSDDAEETGSDPVTITVTDGSDRATDGSGPADTDEGSSRDDDGDDGAGGESGETGVGDDR